jgi:phosphatidylserine/phosphatidylglycerophosphate/cardiolipin synthase-like enzyme
MTHVHQAISHAHHGSTIRIALYSFNRKDMVQALQNACRRGVAVQMVLNNNTITPQINRMKRFLGSNINPHYSDRCHPRNKKKQPQPYQTPSFFVVCSQACRTDSTVGNQHMKIYLFSHTGGARHVLMLGSNNLASYAAHVHWNDLFTITGHVAMFQEYAAVIDQLAQNHGVPDPYEVYTNGDLVSEFGPDNRQRGTSDPVAQRLSQVSCKAMPGSGVHGHTMIHISMYAGVGKRGIYLANRVARLISQGCRVRAILSGAGFRVAHILKRAGASLRTADLDTDHNPNTGFEDTPWEHFTHEKWMTLDGTWAGGPSRIVWTGSENWSDQSLHNDEVTIQIPWRSAVKGYITHFNYVWAHHTRRMGPDVIQHLRDPHARTSNIWND